VLVIDVTTGREVYAEHEHQLLPPASLSKILTALIAVNWLPPAAVVPVSPRAAGVAPDKVGMKAGQRWSLTIALHALLIASANDAAYAIAERVAGSVERFGLVMHAAAAQLGMPDQPVLRDPAGLDGTEGAGGGNLMSAWDIAIAARDLMANPTLDAIVGLKRYRFTGPDGIVYALSSHNRAFLNSYPGAVGVKTGYTGPAGVCVAQEAVRGGRTMLAIVMNGVAPDQTAAMLLDKGFATPVAAESGLAQLPPVRRPAPAPAAPPRATASATGIARAAFPAQDGPLVPSTALPPPRRSVGLIAGPVRVGAVLAGAGAIGIGAGMAVRRRARRDRLDQA
jgi:D-alanyl-D-alanine carboxypeptidase